MAKLPPPLLARLGPATATALQGAVDAIGEELAIVHEINRRDHREARGDNAQIYGAKNYYHGRFRLEGRFDGDPAVSVIRWKGAYKVVVPPVNIGVYALGNFAEDDIHGHFPDDSPTKRDYGHHNRDQLAFFETEVESPLPPEARYGLNDLILGHFGNPREGLTKWYVGAYVMNQGGKPRWAWVERQEDPDQGVQPLPERGPIVPYGSGEVEALQVRPRQTGVQRAE
jgi:hypothetical protein